MSPAAKVLERARQMEVKLEVRGGRLAYDAPPDVSPDLFAQLREHKPELLELLAAKEADKPALQASGPDVGDDLPPGVAEGVQAILAAEGAKGVPIWHWPRVQRAVHRVVERGWAQQALALGWTAADLFGCDRRAPWYRLDRAGLVLLIGEHEIVELTADVAVLRTSTGSVLRFRRRPPARPPVALLWELLIPTQPTGPQIRGPTAHQNEERMAATFLAGPRRHPDHDHLSEEDHGWIDSARPVR